MKIKQRGFTIIEVLMFLAISAGLFLVAFLSYSTQNRRTAFTNAVRNFDLHIQDVLNDVESGFYPTTNNITCTIDEDGRPSFGNTANQQGSSEECIFIGRAVGFRDDSQEYDIYTIAGNREGASSEDATPQSVSPTQVPGLIDTGFIESNLQVEIAGAGGFGGFAIISGLGQFEGTIAQSGALNVSLFGVRCGNPANFDSCLNNPSNYQPLGGNQALNLCVTEAGGGQTARVRVGGHSQRLSTNVIINAPDQGFPGGDPCS